ncbi:ATP-dependent zinc protease [Candidatus Dojkabacteria bacterium]|nr:ATP-dependent zinc protease [Candidatus Dojkabacteria bacterium]
MSLIETLKNQKKVLGINERNLKYIRPLNKKKAKRIADDKLLTKIILTKANIPVPKLIASIANYTELENFNWDNLPKSFVIKPVTGLEGGGIEIFYNRDRNGNWIKADKSKVSLTQLKDLARNILDGKYSLHNTPDKVFFEERVKFHKAFKYYAYKGAPDIRVITYNFIPIMAMIRLPNKESDGKGNLAKGCVGAGIDVATGVTTSAIIGKSQPIENVPGTSLRFGGLKIPYWNKILRYAVEAQKATGLGFAAIDFLIDREQGPVVVELNARPGLSIQLANKDGMRWRLEKARGLKVKSVSHGIRLGKDLFGGEIEEEVENITGKQVIGFVEWVTIFGKKQDQQERVKAKIDTGALFTSIDTKLMIKLGYKDALDYFAKFKIPDTLTRAEAKELSQRIGEKLEKHDDIVGRAIVHSSHGTTLRPTIEIPISISGVEIKVRANVVDRSRLIYPVIVGRRDLTQFIIDPIKKFKG